MVLGTAFVAPEENMESGAGPTHTPPVSPRRRSFFTSNRAGSGSIDGPTFSRHRVLDHVVSKTWASDADLTERQQQQQQVAMLACTTLLAMAYLLQLGNRSSTGLLAPLPACESARTVLVVQGKLWEVLRLSLAALGAVYGAAPPQLPLC